VSVAALLLLPALSFAQAPPEAGPPPAPAEEIIADDATAPDSPRAAMKELFALTRAGRFSEAARYLDAPADADAALLARQLKAVLDRQLWVDPDVLSAHPMGDPDDKLPPGVDELGKIAGPEGSPEPMRIVRRQFPDGHRWVFSRRTVERIGDWYDALRDRWFIENMPPPLLRPGPRGLLLWQWLALPLLLFAAWGIGRALGWITQLVLGRLAARTSGTWDDALLVRLRRPIRGLWALIALEIILPRLALHPPAEAFLQKILRALLFITFFWGLLRSVDVIGDFLVNHWEKTKDAQGIRAIVPVAESIVKIFVVGMGLIVILSEFGYPAASLITGLGVGGVALALAAQKTVENLFGSVSIGVDKPFRVGDFVKVEDISGTVELIGLRSTRIRTLDRTIITIPNGRLADMRIESFAPRDRIRLSFKLGLLYETTGAQMREVLDGIERSLREHPKIWTDSLVVRFESFGESSLNIQVMAWFTTADFDEFQLIRQEVLLQFMDIVERAGTGFAFPTQTVHLAGDEKLLPVRVETAEPRPKALTAAAGA
jgi:MscS family membrane protein